jgi:alkylation response protein AidB-like acyl-CoA dehydrogenase
MNQVFFDDVRVCVGNLVGAENGGWEIAKYLLVYERGAGAAAAGLKSRLRRVRAIAANAQFDGKTLLQDSAFRARLARLEIEVAALELAEYRVISALSKGTLDDRVSSVQKLMTAELRQKVAELMIDVTGHYASVDQSGALYRDRAAAPIGPEYTLTPTASFLNSRATTIFGGTAEIQRNIVARTVLGL